MIAPLWLDYRRAPPGRHRPGWILLSLAVLAAALLLSDYAMVNADIEAAQAGLARAEAQRLAAAPAEEGGEGGMAPVATARWEAMFAALEAAASDDVTLLSLRPGPGEWRIGGEARNNDAAVDYAARLSAAKVFDGVNLTQTEVMREQPMQPVRFALQAQWGGAAP